jgi:hypothetical protein
VTTAADARAEFKKTDEFILDNGAVVEVFHDADTGEWVFVVFESDYVVYYKDGEDNPNPEDSTGDGRSDWQGRLDLAKQKGGGAITIDPQDFLFGQGQTARGEGLVSVHNPFDVFRAYEEETGGGGFGGGYSGDGEGFAAWLRSKIKHGGGGGGGGGGGEDDYGDEDKDPSKGMFPSGEELPGPPELVNPPK